jgi:hypothetical protein
MSPRKAGLASMMLPSARLLSMIPTGEAWKTARNRASLAWSACSASFRSVMSSSMTTNSPRTGQ